MVSQEVNEGRGVLGVVKRASTALLLVAMLGAIVGSAVAWSLGYRVYAVQTGSMSPAYPTGALVVDVPPAADGGATGSVITFDLGDGLVTHRVYGTTSAGVTTKGDANLTPDSWTIPPRAVVGQVVATVPRMGYVLVFFKQPAGVAAVMGGLLSMVLLWQLFFPDIDDESAPIAIPA